MSFPRYPKYKQSGVKWLGEVPEHWHVDRLKHLAAVYPSNVDKKIYENEIPVRLCNYTDVYYHDHIVDSMVFMEATASEEQIKRFTLETGDVIITKDSETADDIARSAYVANRMPGVVCGYHLAVIRPNEGASGCYIKSLFDSTFMRAQVEVRANGLTRVGLSQYAIDNLLLPVPSLEEQSTITSFLARETAKIDALVEEQRRLIELLKEKRQAVISHAVTKGLDPNAPMKDSGIEWIGDVPAHWSVMRLKFVADVRGGVAKGRDLEGEETIEVPYLRVANVQDGHLDLDQISMIAIARHELERYRLMPGDVLMNEGGDFDKLGRGHIWRGEIDDCIHQNHVFSVRPHSCESEWLSLITTAECGRFYFMSRSKQSTNLASISSSNLQELQVPLPPSSERRAILAGVAEFTNHLNSLTERASQAVALLQERRSALISAAVTGKIDVRGLTPKEPS